METPEISPGYESDQHKMGSDDITCSHTPLHFLTTEACKHKYSISTRQHIMKKDNMEGEIEL